MPPCWQNIPYEFFWGSGISRRKRETYGWLSKDALTIPYRPVLAAGTRFQVVIDEKPGQGPLEGLRAALSICKSDSLVVTTCDTPLFSSTLAQLLMEACQGCSAVACMDRKGSLHPSFAGTEIPDETLYNVNTQEEFAALTMKNP